MNRKKLEGLTAHFRRRGERRPSAPVFTGIIIGVKKSAGRGQPEYLVLKLPGGMETELQRCDCTIEVPAAGTPWERVLQDNAGVPGIDHIGVKLLCYSDRTTLFSRLTLDALIYESETFESGSVTLDPGDDKPFEGKPSLDSFHVTYKVGSIELEIEDTNRYQ